MTPGSVINILLEQESEEKFVSREVIESMIKDGAEILETKTPTLKDLKRTTTIKYGGKQFTCKHEIPLRILNFPNSYFDGSRFFRKNQREETG